MSLQQIIIENNIEIGLWKIEESVQELTDRLMYIETPEGPNGIRDYVHSYIRLKTDKQRKEFLVSRLLLEILKKKSENEVLKMNPYSKMYYNKFGAPQLKLASWGEQEKMFQMYISISHSKGLVAVLIGDNKVGLDIEQISDKPLKLSSKFITKNIHENLSKEKATLIWCAKEAIYKWYQKGEVDFTKDIIIPPFVLKEKGQIKIQIKKNSLILNYQKINNHYLVYVCK